MSCEAKLAWARKHLDAAYTSFVEFGKTNPYRTTTDCDEETFVGSEKHGAFSVRAFLDRPLPDAIALHVGDCVHNMRSALDHLVFSVSGSPASDRYIQFPIYLMAEDYRSGLWKLKNVPPLALTSIERLQPYHRGNEADSHPLAMLATLDNIDKHRRLVLSASIATIKVVEGNYQGRLRIDVHGRNGAVFDSGAVIANFEIALENPDSIVHMDYDTQFAVALAEPAPLFERDVLKLLAEIYNYIRQTLLPEFEALL